MTIDVDEKALFAEESCELSSPRTSEDLAALLRERTPDAIIERRKNDG